MSRPVRFLTTAVALLMMAGWVTGAHGAQGAAGAANLPVTPPAAPSPAAPSGGARAVDPMIEGPRLLQRACTVCHSADTVLAERKTASGWRYTIDSMIGRGADLTEDEAKTLHAYLAAARGA